MDNSIPDPTTPILSPGSGISTPIVSWTGSESPDPLFTCGWQDVFPFGPERGPGIVAMLPTQPVIGASAEIVADNGPDYSTENASVCLIDEHTYLTPDPVYGPTGAAILTGRNAVFLVAAEPLTWSRYHVILHQPGKSDIAWSFIATPYGPVAGGKTLVLHVADSGVQSVLGNLTVTNPGHGGYTTAYPCLQGRPTASTNNFTTGQTIPNFAAIAPDANGDICVYTSADTELIWDQVIETNRFGVHKAVRKLDTRSGTKPAAGGVVRVHAAEPGTQTVLGNLTVTAPAAGGYTTAFPCLDGRPTASNNNFSKGQTIPNFVAIHPDANGDICLFTSASAHLIWDQVAETNTFTSHNATRVLDTRAGVKLAAGGVVQVHVADPGTLTVMGNLLTVTAPVASGYTTAYPCHDGRPTASNNNFSKGQTIPNFVAVHPDANGDICFFTSASSHLIWDQVGKTNAFTAHNAVRIYDTRSPRAY